MLLNLFLIMCATIKALLHDNKDSKSVMLVLAFVKFDMFSKLLLLVIHGLAK